jgi:hypothetical protein
MVAAASFSYELESSLTRDTASAVARSFNAEIWAAQANQVAANKTVAIRTGAQRSVVETSLRKEQTSGGLLLPYLPANLRS